MGSFNSSGVLENKWRIPEFFPDLEQDLRSKLRVFHMELLRFNARLNLISRRTEIDADLVHFADSLMACRIILKMVDVSEIHDVGSGNGFPGVILALLAPRASVKLVDKDARKVEFLKHVAAKLELTNVEAVHGLVEKLPKNSISYAISRGYASIGQSLVATSKSFKPGGIYFHMKGSAWGREVAEIPTQLCRNWKPSLVGHYTLPLHGAQLTLVQTQFTEG